MSIHIIQQPVYFSSMILRKCRLFIKKKKNYLNINTTNNEAFGKKIKFHLSRNQYNKQLLHVKI